jgi:predicted peptidase
MKQKKHSFSTRIGKKKLSLQYLLYLPKDYDQTSDHKWPLIVFLHGQGERGSDLDLLKKHGIPKIVEEREYFPFVVVSPQCPQRSSWLRKMDALRALIHNIIHSYQIDIARIYLTGISMGGFGAWHFAEAYPSLFAAIVPICGGTEPQDGFPERIHVLKDIPIWVFHGAKDRAVPVQMSQVLVDVLKAHHGNVQFTIYPDAGHDAWTRTYNNPKLYDWLLTQKNDHFQIA